MSQQGNPLVPLSRVERSNDLLKKQISLSSASEQVHEDARERAVLMDCQVDLAALAWLAFSSWQARPVARVLSSIDVRVFRSR